jgi:integrase
VNRWRGSLFSLGAALVLRGLLASNPVARVRPETVGMPRVERRALTSDEVDRLLACADARGDDEVSLWIRLGLHAGLRRGECRRLPWSAVNLDEKTITSRRTRRSGRRCRCCPTSSTACGT